MAGHSPRNLLECKSPFSSQPRQQPCEHPSRLLLQPAPGPPWKEESQEEGFGIRHGRAFQALISGAKLPASRPPAPRPQGCRTRDEELQLLHRTAARGQKLGQNLGQKLGQHVEGKACSSQLQPWAIEWLLPAAQGVTSAPRSFRRFPAPPGTQPRSFLPAAHPSPSTAWQTPHKCPRGINLPPGSSFPPRPR